MFQKLRDIFSWLLVDSDPRNSRGVGEIRKEPVATGSFSTNCIDNSIISSLDCFIKLNLIINDFFILNLKKDNILCL